MWGAEGMDTDTTVSVMSSLVLPCQLLSHPPKKPLLLSLLPAHALLTFSSPTGVRDTMLLLIFQVISPLQQLSLSGAASLPGHTLQVCTQSKFSSHLSTCRSAGIDFIHMVVEALGGWSSETVINIQGIREALGLLSNPLVLLGQLNISLVAWELPCRGGCLCLAASCTLAFLCHKQNFLGDLIVQYNRNLVT